MARTSSSSIVSFVLLGAAALVLMGLGLRSVTTERAAAERSERNRLRAELSRAEGEIEAAGDDLLERVRRGDGDARASDGVFERPASPTTLTRLDVPPGRDPFGTWLLESAEAIEFVERDAGRAREMYLAVGAGGVDEDVRRVALGRLAAQSRAAGDLDDARLFSMRLLAGLDEVRRRTTVEALLARLEVRDPEDRSLGEDLLAALGGPDDVIARGLLARAGVDATAIARRDAEVRLVRRLAPWLPDAERSGEGLVLTDGHLVAWSQDGDGAVALGAAPRPRLGDVAVLARAEDRAPDSGTAIVEVVALRRHPGVRLAASRARADVLAGADGRSLALLLALVALVVAGGLAVRQTLAAARRESEAASARERFLQRVGHDLRTPLTLVRMYAETLADGRVDDPAEAREFAGIAAREARRLARMVDGVLDLTGHDGESGRAARRPLDLASLVRTVVDAHRPLLEEVGLRLRVDAVEGEARVEAEDDALRGAVGNLLENASKYAPQGGEVRVRVTTDEEFVRVVVADRGPGLPAGRESEMFERFVRGEDAAAPGTGLGLALVREVARRHGGDATARPRDGGGAEIEIALPRASGGAS